jgi:hypothetical protein
MRYPRYVAHCRIALCLRCPWAPLGTHTAPCPLHAGLLCGGGFFPCAECTSMSVGALWRRNFPQELVARTRSCTKLSTRHCARRRTICGSRNLVISDNNRLISRVTLANSQVLLTAQACKFACCIQGRARGRRRRPLRLSKVSGRVGRHKIQWQRHARRPRGGAAKDAGAVCGARQAHSGFIVL